jgi:hypothetical protein
MTATYVADAQLDRASFSADVVPALGRLAETAIDTVAGKLSLKVDGWIDRLEEHASSEGAAGRAGYEGLKAHLLGKNPLWAAMKGAWWGASAQLRVVVVLVLVLVLLLAPVVLVLLLLGLLLAAIVAGVSAASR